MPIAYYLNKAAHLCDESLLMATIKSTFGIHYKDEILLTYFVIDLNIVLQKKYSV